MANNTTDQYEDIEVAPWTIEAAAKEIEYLMSYPAFGRLCISAYIVYERLCTDYEVNGEHWPSMQECELLVNGSEEEYPTIFRTFKNTADFITTCIQNNTKHIPYLSAQ